MKKATVWKFQLKADFVYETGIPAIMVVQGTSVHFPDNNGTTWLNISNTGTILIRKGYRWDGCSPKVRVGPFLFGIPDGAPHPETGYPLTYRASLVHDVLYQNLDNPLMPFTREQADKIFHEILTQDGFSWANQYYWFVRKFGGICRQIAKWVNKNGY